MMCSLKFLVLCLLSTYILNAQSIKILTNHLGYDVNAPKHAVVEGTATDQVNAWSLFDYTSGKKILSGIPKKTGPVAKWKNWHFWSIDFDQLNKEGEYYLECATSKGVVRSFPFKIQKNILERYTLSDNIAWFKSQRSSGLLDKADRNLPFESKEGRVDARGGWYDATGDYGKHLSHLSFSTYFNPQQTSLTVWSLFKTWFKLEARNDPDFTQYKRRLLDEAMHGADFLVRMKSPEGSFYRSVGSPGPGKKPEDRRISQDSKGFAIKTDVNKFDRNPGKVDNIAGNATYQTSYRSGAGVSIGALAMASTFSVSGDFSNADYLRVAEEVFAHLEKNNAVYTNDGKENIVDEYCALIAATELYRASKKEDYKSAADKYASRLMARLVSKGKYQNYWKADDGDRPFFHAADAGMPVVSLLGYAEIADATKQKQVMETVKKSLQHELRITAEVSNPFGYGRQLVRSKDGRVYPAFFFPHDTETAPWWQGENARLGSMAAAARMASPYFKDAGAFQKELQAYAINQLNWILGLNPYDASMLHGTGRNNISYMFFKSYQYTNAPGGIVNGITGGMNDPDDIDYDLGYEKTGKDDDWRWGEQWLPHVAWYMYAISLQ